jgi:hypothetical protein
MNMIGRSLEYYSEKNVPAYVMMLGIRSAPDSMLARVLMLNSKEKLRSRIISFQATMDKLDRATSAYLTRKRAAKNFVVQGDGQIT